jgi:3'(2'), 5'-bisphosphate nucleotidase
MTTDDASLAAPLVSVAIAAGKAILDVYHGDFDVTIKADASPLTVADLRSHDIILAGLAEHAPGIPVVSEESAPPPLAERAHWPALFLVDPLDGTKEFVHRNGEFTVNIALIRGGRPVMGILHLPLAGITYFAAEGLGAWRQDASGERTPVHVRPSIAGLPRVVGSRSHRGSSLDRFLDAIGPHEFLALGSAAKFGAIAEGRCDLYPRVGPTSEWDTAAGQAIVEIAGGHVVDREGSPLRYNAKEDWLNPDFVVYADGSRPWHRWL